MLKKASIWFLMLTKRLLIKKGFVALLIIIPCLIPAVNFALQGDSGVVWVGLCNLQEDGNSAQEVVERLTTEESVISYLQYDNADSAAEALQSGEVDVVWIFHEDFDERLRKYTARESIRPVVTIRCREESIRFSLTREKLFAELYELMVYEQYENFVRREIMNGEEISDHELRKFYQNNTMPSELIEIRMQDSDGDAGIGADYLTAPLRGLMSLIVMLCGFVAAGISMKERNRGTYTWLPKPRRIIPVFGSCLAAAMLSGGVVLVALFAGGIASGILTEFAMMAAYVLAVAGVCTLITVLFDSFEAFGALIPFVMLAMLVMCPVFFTVRNFPAIRLLMPPYYYLMAVNYSEYTLYMLAYAVVTTLLSGITANCKKRM